MSLELLHSNLVAKKELSESKISNYVDTMDTLTAEAALLAEQKQIYEEQKLSMKESDVCSLGGWKAVKQTYDRTLRQLDNNQSKRDTTEAALQIEQKNLSELTRQITHIQAELDSYGKLYQFPVPE